jgi:outer membrane protein OmpA-like peptidoglycan-associated protein
MAGYGAILVAGVVGGGLLAGATLSMRAEVNSAARRLHSGAEEKPAAKVAQADDAELPYCTPEFKQVLSRVIHACGLSGAEGRRGCQPADVKTLASISDEDFNKLFTPLKDRAAVVMFSDGADALDDAAKKALDDRWQERRGARYFFVVARASKTGPADFNRKLSHKRANSVMFYLSDKYKDPEIDKKVGMLWLGKEFAQLDQQYCKWAVTRPDKCDVDAINRSAFVSWVDCRL